VNAAFRLEASQQHVYLKAPVGSYFTSKVCSSDAGDEEDRVHRRMYRDRER